MTGLGAVFAMGATPTVYAATSKDAGVLAMLGGQPVRTKPWQ